MTEKFPAKRCIREPSCDRIRLLKKVSACNGRSAGLSGHASCFMYLQADHWEQPAAYRGSQIVLMTRWVESPSIRRRGQGDCAVCVEDLLELSEDWLKYAIRFHVDHAARDLPLLKEKALKETRIQEFLRDAANFHDVPLSNQKNPDLAIHKLLFLLDAGFGTEVPEVVGAIQRILEHQDAGGIYQSKICIPRQYGGTGEAVFGWSLCDAPLLLQALLKAGVDYGTHIEQGVETLITLIRENGLPCASSREFGAFRGPGR